MQILEKIDQNAMFSAVYETLGRGGTIGIFPEGGSHDRTQLLPLKAGVSMMALGTVDMKGKTVYIVPCGLNYFAGHRFRSHVMVEYGQPIVIDVDDPLAIQYKINKRESCSTLLKNVEARLRSVTLNVPDYHLLRAVHTVRRLYRPTNMKYVLFHSLFLSISLHLSTSPISPFSILHFPSSSHSLHL
jgi:glycerol-3-phosphate O-acyltransferase/dihydroxyacetone phosphate acyltransferase